MVKYSFNKTNNHLSPKLIERDLIEQKKDQNIQYIAIVNVGALSESEILQREKKKLIKQW